jgi:hypothetical protein
MIKGGLRARKPLGKRALESARGLCKVQIEARFPR